MSLKAIVKSVSSGDSLILRGRPGPQGQPAKERVLHLADIFAPKLGNTTRDDEEYAFESREFLRVLAVGKEVAFTSSHSLSSGDDNTRDIGNAEIGGQDIALEMLRSGWAKLKELKREPTEEDIRKKEVESEAKAAGRGLWNPHGQKARAIHYMMPTDSTAFISDWKGRKIDAIIEQVKDGSTLRVRLLMPDGEHQFINLSLAGVRAPRTSTKPGEQSEQWAEEAKFFTESKLLQRSVSVQLLSLPTATATAFPTGTAPAPPTSVTIFIGSVLHPAGNIAEHLVAAGLARVVGWHAGMLANGGAMERLRVAEKTAKEKRAYLYTNTTPSTTKSNGSVAPGNSRNFDATVIRVWSGDQISVIEKEGGKERRIQLSSTRAPKLTDPKQAFYVQEAREFLRKKLIGKQIKVTIDFVRPREGEYEERECVTVRYGNHNINIAEQIIEKGLATVVRHKRDDEDRSSDFDKLMAAEQAAVTALHGIHSGKEQPVPKPPLNISETSHRATPFVNSFKRQGRIPAVVDYVSAGSRFKIFLAKDNQVLTLVLSGIRAPRTARSQTDKGEPYGTEAFDFATRRYMQRDVEIEIDSVDKSGGFIGALFLNKTENAALTLLREGLATVHSYSADALSWARQLYDAEADAKSKKLNIWKDYDEEAEKETEVVENADPTPLKTEYLDIIISDVRTKPAFGFSVQILNTEGIASLEELMRDFSLHHKTVAPAIPFVPKAGDLVSAKFFDGSWYRAKVRRASPIKKEAEVTFIDYGNADTIAFSNIRPLDPKFRSLPGQAHDARLSFIKLVGSNSEYHAEAIERFRQLCEGRKLIANIDQKEGPLLHLRLVDPTDPAASKDPLDCINSTLMSEGYASLDRKGCKYLPAYPNVVKRLQEALKVAKRDRQGMFEFGDVEEDDEGH